MQLAKCLVLVVASVLADASSSDGSSLELRSQHSLESSLRSKAFHCCPHSFEVCDTADGRAEVTELFNKRV
jgi:hypothetical protein